MSDAVFGTQAPLYWERGLPIIPVEPGTKRPPLDMKGWQGHLAALPNEQTRNHWQERYPAHGIGVLLGFQAAAGVHINAVDVDDDRLQRMVLEFLGLNRSERRACIAGKRGKKGVTVFVRSPKSLKSTTIKGVEGLGNIDFLAAGRMTVMPPSVHPDTGRPYEIVGKPLHEVDFDELPKFTEREVAILKAALGSVHVLTIIGGTATHDAGVPFTAVLVRTGATDEEIKAIFVGLLPENYDGDSLKELPGWIKSAREKGFDEQTPASQTMTAALVLLALSEVVELFNDGDGNAFATLPSSGPAIAHRITSGGFKTWLRHRAHREMEKPVGTGPLNEAIATIEAVALFDGKSQAVNVRIAGDSQAVSIDLGRPDGTVLHIDKQGWSTQANTLYKFVRGAGFEQLPNPAKEGDLRPLQTFFGLDDQNYRLLIAFLINALKPSGPYFILLVEGEQGSGKSFFCEIIKRIIDPNKALRLRLPEKPQDLMIQAKEYRLLSFDNASGMKAEMSDVLCSLATGGGIAVRKLYSDGDLYVMSFARPFMINGISGYANRPDLMERGIPIKLVPMPEGGRKTEAELMSEFERILPSILGGLYEAVSHALQTFDDTEPPRHLRMADAARWIKAAETALGEEPGAIIEAIATAQHEFVVDRVNDDPLVMKLRAITRTDPFVGYIGDLFARIVDHEDRAFERGLPQSPSRLSNQLDRMRPAMAKAGVIVEFLEKDRRGRMIRVSSSDSMGLPKF